ncbi:MAG: ribulokinase [Clostridia bacterium]|nr:ribulokinase [Clostridia bacterium]
MKKYVIGTDFGTLSGRTVLVDTATGEELAESVLAYAHGVMDGQIPTGKKLPANYALQYPTDYLEVLRTTIPDVIRKASVSAEDIAAMAIDFTACTVLPIDAEGCPLCMKKEYENEPHAYVKLWKHHGAQKYADEINALAKQRGEAWLDIYGGKISCEWALPKILEVLREAPDIYKNTHRFTEAADWLSLVLTGEETHSAAFAGYKALWNKETGYPADEFMTALDAGLSGIVGTKLSENVLGVDSIAGYLCAEGARLTGLPEGVPVAMPMIDGHAGITALNVTGEGDMMMILGTSSCQMINSTVKTNIDGICGYVDGAVIPEYCTYEAGLAGVGDVFDWFVHNEVPESYEAEAKERGIGIHKLLREKAMKLVPGESGLLALDWLNGNRNILVNSNLSGMILGLNLGTKAEEIYRALIEATAYGTRVIFEQYEKYGLSINKVCVGGGIAQKDEMMMQIYADVLGKELCVAGTTQAGALGSAIYASVAAGIYPDVVTAAAHMSRPPIKSYTPIPENVSVYNTLYGEYRRLYDYFGKENQVMERLTDMRR